MTYIFLPYYIVALFLSPQLILQYLMQVLETFGTKFKLCIWHVHEGNGISIALFLSKYCRIMSPFQHISSPFVVTLTTSFMNVIVILGMSVA